MNARELGPRYWDHLYCGIKLHGARAKGNHRTIKRQVFIRQFAQITQHIGFRLNTRKNRMAQNSSFALYNARDAGQASDR